jgi:hypothetical protein
VVLEEARGSLIKQKLRRCRNGSDRIRFEFENGSPNPEKSKVLILLASLLPSEVLNFELVQSLRSIKEKSGKLFIKNITPHLLVMIPK